MKVVLVLALLSAALCAKGYATRYWDCCKPHCSWPGNSNPLARTCDKSQNTISDPNASSACDGGPAATCLDQVPQIVNDNLAYAFAATPGGSNDCRKCYKLTFDGQGKYGSNGNHAAIKGKTLIVMSSNIGYDVAGGQFDIMIPGGGVGIFNGCAGLFSGDMGAQYGGLLTACNGDRGCLQNKCKSTFTQSQAQEGCLFLANWMHAADNPSLDYEETSCPGDLTSRY